ncbi:MAG: hypothetical protein KME54_05780 [Tolypothrix brevis GSE-NOS-MK-07-07A]|jgi:hypothetical protein|nr:hypothetical protein [Tolypothrix brevis GSE-NOS-MK-07-07A]
MSPLKRRQFGQLAAASLTSTILADLSSKALAQKSDPSQEILYGVNLPSESNAQNRNREDQNARVSLSTADRATGKVLSQIDVPSQAVENRSSVPRQSRAFFTGDSDRITKAAALGDGNLVISTVSNTRNGYFNHLIFSVGGAKNPQFRVKTVLGFESSNQTVESLLRLPNNQLLSLIGTRGIPPFTFRIIDSITGKILSADELNLPPLPPNHRFSNLSQDPKGNIFATEISAEGVPILISMNLQEKAVITGKVKINRLTPLTFEGRPLSNDVKELNFSSSGQLYALAADNIRKNNALFTVDVNSGKIGLASEFAADKFVFI